MVAVDATGTVTRERPAAGRSIWKTLGRSAGARILVLPVSAILGIVNTRIIIEHFGRAAYAQYGLLVGIVSLLPFADLGVSAAVMNAIGGSADPANDPRVRRVLTTAIRVLIGSMLTLIVLSVIVSVAGLWPSILGDGLVPHTGPIVAALCLGAVAISMPAGIGQRIMTGLGRNHITIMMMGMQTPIVVLVLLCVVQFDLGFGAYIAVVPYLVTFGLAVAVTVRGSRRIEPVFGQALRDAPKLRTVEGGKVFDTAWPMLLQMIALPIAMQTDRIILSHVSDQKNLAEYNLASQMYSPIWQVTSAAGIALWPIFAKARANAGAPGQSWRRRGPSPMRISLIFGAIAAVLCGIITLASPWLSARASGGAIHLQASIIIAFSVFMVLQALKYPLGMYMTDPKGLRYQAFMILLLLPVNVGVSWYLAKQIGAPGPIVGSCIGVFCCQVVANWLYVRRQRRGRHFRR